MAAEQDLFHLDLTLKTGASPTRWVYVLHGILGQGGNLRTLARRWIEHRTDTGAVLVDLRNHGRSLHLAPPDDLAACAADVERLAASLGRPPAAVLGHSFGGKVAMKLAQRAYERGTPLGALWVLDSTPGPKTLDQIDSRPGTTRAIVELLDGLPRWFASREEFSHRLEAHGLAPSLVAWLSMSVQRDGESYRFGPEISRIRAMLASYFVEDLWPVVATPMADQVHVVVAGKSSTFNADERARLRTLAAANPDHVHMHLYEESSHWVHVDAADALDEALETAG